MPDPRSENLSERVEKILTNDLIEVDGRLLVRCEVPGCERKATEARRQRSGDVVHVCGEPHVYGDLAPDPTTGIITTKQMIDLARAGGDLLPPEEGTADQWWPASDEGDPPVNMLVLGVAHHHATGHLCGGGGYSFDCEDCDFAIDDGVVLASGWVRFKAEDDR